ncbi:MAG: type IX secretion system plug protein domain-containing protein [Bacteroidota bacterium]
MIRITSLFLTLLSTSLTFAQELVFDNYIYDPKVQSVIFSKAGVDDRFPIMTLNSSEQLQLGFDIVGNRNEYFQYSLTHCDANWNPTPLGQNEYINGLTIDNINDFRFSTNTYVKYVHYNLILPNDNMKPRIAGNYLVKVFRNFDEEDLVLTRRMMVMNPNVTIDGKVQPATLAQYRFTKQEIQFNINYKGYNVPNPFGDISVVITQNGRWDNAIRGLKPQFIADNVLQYNSLDQAIFPGGNEFRFFDFRSLRTLSPNVRSKTFDSLYHVILNYDESRGSKQYFQYLDNNGRRILANKDGINSDLDGDYAWVNFYLMSMNPIQDGDVYVFGEFTDWKLLPKYKMYYNKNRGRYDLEVQLKQGRYEYIYAVKNETTGQPDEVSLEGSSSNTENEYLILVYHKNIQYKYDELVGMKKLSTSAQ